MNAYLNRWYTPKGTFGIWTMPEFSCLTVERPPVNNQPFISCIPEGVYTCERVQSHKFGETFEVMDVQNRTLIRIHWGSYPSDYQGCIGMGRGFISNWGLGSTRVTFNTFMQHMNGIDHFQLAITQDKPEGMT